MAVFSAQCFLRALLSLHTLKQFGFLWDIQHWLQTLSPQNSPVQKECIYEFSQKAREASECHRIHHAYFKIGQLLQKDGVQTQAYERDCHIYFKDRHTECFTGFL